jgi:hypothetical protein
MSPWMTIERLQGGCQKNGGEEDNLATDDVVAT